MIIQVDTTAIDTANLKRAAYPPVPVTQENAEALAWSSWCPVQQALQRAFPGERVTVPGGLGFLVHGKDRYGVWEPTIKYELPYWVAKLIDHWDETGEMEPFCFDVTLCTT